MQETANQKKARLLGMPFGTASGKLRKMLLFEAAIATSRDTCYRCGIKITSIEEFSIEHKVAWSGSSDPKALFFDLSNIAYSHLSCNVSAADRPPSKYTSEKHRSSVRNTKRRSDQANVEKDNEARRIRRSEGKAN